MGLVMGNAVVMQENRCCGEEWYTFFLEPWVHYLRNL